MMKLKTHHVLSWWTSYLRDFMVILGLVAAVAVTSAQEGKPIDEDAQPAATPVSPAMPAPTQPVADSKMPDISGTWRVRVAFPVNRSVEAGEMEIRKIEAGDTDFLIDQPWVTHPTRIPVKWSPARQQFEGTWWEDDGSQSKITMQFPADSKTMRVVISTRKQDGDMTATQREESSNQEWTRRSLSLSTKFPAEMYGLSATPASSENLKVAEVESNRSGSDDRRTDLSHVTRALPDTPAAKQWIEQLGAQEAAAAAEAATIRQLQANGHAERNQQPIAEHQRKLQNLLSTAFDLKLQLEELQVKELQSRLNRLERQIGQRQELREKIIARRAGELIEDERLKWSPSAPLIRRANEREVSERGSLLGMPPTSRQPSGESVTSPPSVGLGTKGLNSLGSMPQPAAPPKGLEFLSQYPRFSGLSLDTTEGQFRAFLEKQKLAPQLSIPQDGQLNYSVPLGDGNRLTVMFGLDGQCRGIERISGAAPSPVLSHPAAPAPVRPEKVVAKIFSLEQVDAASVAKTLQELASEKPFSARISADVASNSVIVFANPDDMPVIEAIVIRLDKAPDPPNPKAAPQPESDSSATPATSGTSNASQQKPDQIVINLYGVPRATPGLTKSLSGTGFLGSLNTLPGVVTNSVEGDDFVMAIVRDPSLRCQRETQRTRKESELRLAINSALKAGGIQAVRWEEGAREDETRKSKTDGKAATLDPLSVPQKLRDQIVIDLYGGSKVLPGLPQNPSYSKLIQSLNALKGVTTNFREIQAGDATTIVMAMVYDPSQRCQREARQMQKESELRVAINSALEAAGIEATRWDENSDAKSADISAPAE